MAIRALDDLVVVEFAQMVSGPMCGKMFADMGAEVVKIEPPCAGDEMRAHPPFPGDVPHPEKSGSFLYLNTSKKSLTLDPSTPTGAEVFRKLIAGADVLIENHQPEYLDSIGLGYEALKTINPKLIVTSISPFGQTGPYRNWKGTDLIEFAMSLTGYNTPTMVDDPERENPIRAPGHQAEMMGATAAAAATMFAIFHREATGVGQWIDAPCWQAIASTSKIEMAALTYARLPFSRMRGNVATGLEPLRCKDGYIYTLWAADTHYKALKALLHNPVEMESEVFDLLVGRQANDDVLRPMIRAELLKYDTEHLVSEGQRLGLTIGPVFTVAQAANHPHLRARNAFIEIDHPIAGRFQYPRSLVQMTATPPMPTRAPLLGEHNAEILSRLGYSLDEQQRMRAAGAI
ncbi:MAG: CaiB/BaiF CoA-transferase family protein [Candidatus Binatus sp.]|uniref:CaiB/BaiF CoA transferase family protein n=1 Tax=Candidatus Binatus sp. TaxID=2811406 RepID=UPI0027291855|nr:CaiB/BaiF CoA-transferase family protein [Candidatus Binatus sp.]MDO8431830.1 CaiB/BaiF CoA-transferase family protein [Candidatus Binatus sp.]